MIDKKDIRLRKFITIMMACLSSFLLFGCGSKQVNEVPEVQEIVFDEEDDYDENLDDEQEEEELEEDDQEETKKEDMPKPVIDFDFSTDFVWKEEFNTVKINDCEITLGVTTLNDLVKDFPYIEEYMKEKSEWKKEDYDDYFPGSLDDEVDLLWESFDLMEYEILEVEIWSDDGGKVGDLPITSVSYQPKSNSRVKFEGYVTPNDTQAEVFEKLGNPSFASIGAFDDVLLCMWEPNELDPDEKITITFYGDGTMESILIECE